MNLVRKLLRQFNGLHYPQEYLCFAGESFQSSLHVCLVSNGRVISDVTHSHLFVGYHPLIFALTSSPELPLQSETIDLILSHQPIKPNASFSEKVALARLSLRRIHQFPLENGIVHFYEGVKGEHRFTSSFQQFIDQLSNKLYNRKPGNVFLEGNLYRQVQIAYAVPRKISLITVGDRHLFNQFPTDLHGRASDQYYIISLRLGGKACEQVLAHKKIVLSDMDALAYKQVYGLGKNHMQPMKPPSSFNFSDFRSPQFGLPLPQNALSYKELELRGSFVHGIHRLLLFRILNTDVLISNPGTLVHIHNSYATWRFKKGMEGNYLLR